MSSVSWIKIQTDLFENRKIKRIMSKKDGDAVVICWIRLLTLAGEINDGGTVYFTKSEPYTTESLAEVFGKPETLVKRALDMFVQFDMITVSEDGVISINGWNEYQNAERLEKMKEQSRASSAKYRDKKRQKSDAESDTESDMTVTSPVTHGDAIEKEEERERKKELDLSIEREKEEDERVSTPPSRDEISAYIKENNYTVDAVRFYNYYSKREWKNKNGDLIVDHWQGTVDTWQYSDETKTKDKGGGKQKKSGVYYYNDDDNFAADVEKIYRKQMERFKTERAAKMEAE